MRTRTTFSSLAATGVAALAFANIASAQTPAQPATPNQSSRPTVPAPGATMDSVKAKFGAPTQEAPAVGKPPITRWEYPGYVVYFENDKVLHTVIVK